MSTFKDEDKSNRNILNLPSGFTKMDAIRAFAKLKSVLEARITQENLSEEELKEIEEELTAGREQCLAILSMHDITCCDEDRCCEAGCKKDQNACNEACCCNEECYCNEFDGNADIQNNYENGSCNNTCEHQDNNTNAIDKCSSGECCECENENVLNVNVKNIKLDDINSILENNVHCVIGHCEDVKVHESEACVQVEDEDLKCAKIQDTELQTEDPLKMQPSQHDIIVQDLDDIDKRRGFCGFGWLCF